jgi:hypothetical protein
MQHKTVDLRPAFAARGLEPRAQGKRGTCSVFALISLLEFAYQGERLSVEFLNWASHQTNGRTADGSFFSDALAGLGEFGVCSEILLPYAEEFDPELNPNTAAREDALRRTGFSAHWFKEWDVETGLSEEQLAAVRHQLAEGVPVATGLRWPKKAEYLDNSLLVMPPPEEVFDGHSIVLVGYEDDPNQEGGGTFLFRNSSGPEWQEGGYARFSYDYARAYANDAVSLTLEG